MSSIHRLLQQPMRTVQTHSFEVVPPFIHKDQRERYAHRVNEIRVEYDWDDDGDAYVRVSGRTDKVSKTGTKMGTAVSFPIAYYRDELPDLKELVEQAKAAAWARHKTSRRAE